MGDVQHTSLYQIIDEILLKLQTDVDEKIAAQATKSFFTFQKEEHKNRLTSIDQLKETIQGVLYRPDNANYEESWVTALCSLPGLKKSHVAIARLAHVLNLGSNSEEVRFVIVIIAPQKQKFTKNAVEIGRSFSSLMSHASLRQELLEASDETEVKQCIADACERYKKKARQSVNEEQLTQQSLFGGEDNKDYHYIKDFGRGLLDDLKRRLPHYISDYTDGVTGKNSIKKLLSTTFFLFFACLLPDIAFGSLYEKTTNGLMDVSSCIITQTLGGLLFAIFCGQPMCILITTAPLALYVKVIQLITTNYDLNFKEMYTMTGIWNGIFLALFSLFNVSKLMHYSTRSTEEIFGFFIALAFSADAIKAAMANYDKNYNFITPNTTVANMTSDMCTTSIDGDYTCYRPENFILFLFLMLGTLWLGMALLSMDSSQYLSAGKRELLADYALPIAVITFTLIGSIGFKDIKIDRFKYEEGKNYFQLAPFGGLPLGAHFGAMGLGFCLSILFFVDQNVSAALVNAPHNKLKKGPAYHWDLMVIGVINIILSLFNLPWLHAALPHSPLHVRALADVEQHVTSVGAVHDEIVRVRETRLTAILSHILIGLTILIVFVLQYIPIAVLQGLFLYLALSSFIGNQMFERVMLFFTEESSYPPNYYVRKVPIKKLHTFTGVQLIQLLIVSVFGFVNLFYLKMVFPVIILLLLPIRQLLLPKIVERKYLRIIDHSE